jgi:hypothetical protein
VRFGLSSRIIESPFRAAIKIHDPLTLEHLRDARRALSTYCLKPGALCNAYLDLSMSVANPMAIVRLHDLRGSKEYSGLDAGVIRLLDSITDVYAKLLAGLIVTVGENVMVRFKATVGVDGRVYRRGDVARLPVERFVKLAVAGLVEPFESIATLR